MNAHSFWDEHFLVFEQARTEAITLLLCKDVVSIRYTLYRTSLTLSIRWSFSGEDGGRFS